MNAADTYAASFTLSSSFQPSSGAQLALASPAIIRNALFQPVNMSISIPGGNGSSRAYSKT